MGFDKSRLKNLAETATAPAADDYVLLDGATNGTRKMLATVLGLAEVDVTGSGVISKTLENNKKYDFTGVTSLTLVGAAVEAHGILDFANATPTISVSGFDYADGDEISDAAANEIWEFNVAAHGGKSFVCWHKWGTLT